MDGDCHAGWGHGDSCCSLEPPGLCLVKQKTHLCLHTSALIAKAASYKLPVELVLIGGEI